MSKRLDQLKQMKEKTVDELDVFAKDLRRQVQDKQVNRYLTDVTNLRELRLLRKNLARALTVHSEMKTTTSSTEENSKKVVGTKVSKKKTVKKSTPKEAKDE